MKCPLVQLSNMHQELSIKLVLPKPNCNRNKESLETKAGSLQVFRSDSLLLGKESGGLNLNVLCSLVQKQPSGRIWHSIQFFTHCNVSQVMSKHTYVYKEGVIETQQKPLPT